MLWSGTLVTQGTARGLTVATGAGTEIGRIGGLLAGVEQLTTPLVAQMNHFARWLSFLILLAAALLLVYGYSSDITSLTRCSWPWSVLPSRRFPRGCRR
jgi:magnesium-transporting ATPase (P-type)